MAEEKPTKSPRQEYLGLLANILTEANNVHKVLLQQRSKLRGAHKKFIANEALDIIVKRISSHHNIVIGNLNEAAEEEVTLPAPKPIKVPEKLKKKGVDPEAAKALTTCVRAINKLQDAIHKATSFYVVNTPYIQRNQKAAISRALIETVRNLKSERDHLIPPATPDDSVAEEFESRIAELSEMVDERVYLAIVQRMGVDTILGDDEKLSEKSDLNRGIDKPKKVKIGQGKEDDSNPPRGVKVKRSQDQLDEIFGMKRRKAEKEEEKRRKEEEAAEKEAEERYRRHADQMPGREASRRKNKKPKRKPGVGMGVGPAGTLQRFRNTNGKS